MPARDYRMIVSEAVETDRESHDRILETKQTIDDSLNIVYNNHHSISQTKTQTNERVNTGKDCEVIFVSRSTYSNTW